MAKSFQDRFQTDQTDKKPSDVKTIETPQTGFSKSEGQNDGAKLKQEQIAEVLTDKGIGGAGAASPSTASLRTLSYGGNAGTILGSAAGTPTADAPRRADSRFGKKIDDITKKIDYVASEQILEKMKAPKPAYDTDSRQGYNGYPMNENARSQKVVGAHPADPLFERSVDYLTRDELFYISGQYVREQDVDLGDSPTVTANESGQGTTAFTCPRGSYAPRQLRVKFKRDNGGTFVSQFAVDVDDVTPGTAPYQVMNAASQNAVIDMNCAEIDRQAIDANAGQETKDNWSPLGRAIPQSTRTVGYLRDLEMEMGAFMYTSYRFARKAHAYQINKTAKDGAKLYGPMEEMFLADLWGAPSSTFYSGDTIATGERVFNASAYRAGSAAILIDLFDSRSKYNSKGDVLTQPRSLKMHLATGANNIGQFWTKPEFMKVVDAFDTFSVVNDFYDPLMPVAMTDGVRLVTTHNWAQQFQFTRTSSDSGRSYSTTQFAYVYHDRHYNYRIRMGNPILAGIAWWMDQNAHKLYNLIGEEDDGVSYEWIIPIRSTTRAFSLWDYLLMVCMPAIQYERTNAMKDVLDYQSNFKYPFSQLTQISEFVDSFTNYTFTDIYHPLVVGKMREAARLSWVMPELYTVNSFETGGVNQAYVEGPWYMGEADYVFKTGDSVRLANEIGTMNYPVLRAGIHLDALDTFYDNDERTIRLMLDRVVVHPMIYAQNCVAPAGEVLVRKMSQHSEGAIAVRQKSSLSSINTPTGVIKNSVRELGWHAVAPAGWVTPRYNPNTTSSTGYAAYDPDLYYTSTDDYAAIVATSYKAVAYTAQADSQTAILATGNILVDRGSNFTQRWYGVSAVPGHTATGMPSGLSLGVRFDAHVAGGFRAIAPYTTGIAGTTGTQGTTIANFNSVLLDVAQSFWAPVQRLPFIISPFDTSCTARRSDSDSTLYLDEYTVANIFGLSGFLCSDYLEDVAYRANVGQDRGWLYTSDPFVEDSAIFS